MKQRTSHQTYPSAGFTLVELLVVVAIIGVLASILIIRLSGHTDKARVSTARAHISQLETAVITFKGDTGRLPQSLDELINKPGDVTGWQEDGYLKRPPKDPWNHDYVYRITGRKFEIICLGADGNEGGEGYDADISSEGP